MPCGAAQKGREKVGRRRESEHKAWETSFHLTASKATAGPSSHHSWTKGQPQSTIQRKVSSISPKSQKRPELQASPHSALPAALQCYLPAGRRQWQALFSSSDERRRGRAGDKVIPGQCSGLGCDFSLNGGVELTFSDVPPASGSSAHGSTTSHAYWPSPMPLRPSCLHRSQEIDGGLRWPLSIHSQTLLCQTPLCPDSTLCSYPSPPACPCWKDASGKSIPQAPGTPAHSSSP